MIIHLRERNNLRSLGFLLLCWSGLALANDCPHANTTLELNQCLVEQLEQQEVTLHHYLAEARARYLADEVVVEAIDEAQLRWLDYRQQQCGSIYSIWRDGSIRGVMALNCNIRMTRLRTHQIWHSYLTFMDSTPSLLPEPQLAN